MNIRILTLCIPAFCLHLYGCATSDDPGTIDRRVDSGSLNDHRIPPGEERPPGEPAAILVDARPAALVNGRSVNWGDLRPALTEAAGGEVLRELILDQLLASAIRDAGLAVSADDVARERRLMLETLNENSNVAIRLLEELRVRQGLGEQRFNALLQRNASLRKLVAPLVQVSATAVEQLFHVIHGPWRQSRLIVTPNLPAARAAIQRVGSGEPFMDVAVDVSTDSSAARGGLLEPIARTDTSYPEALRNTLWALAPGEVSNPILLGEQYAVLKFEREIEADGTTLEEVRPDLERRVRLSQERARMDQLARAMLADISVTIFDDALRESWRMQQRPEP